MSRDIFVQDLPRGIRSVADIPDDFEPKPIGNRADIIATIKLIAPRADFRDPAWGVIAEPNVFHIEVSLGPDDQLNGFAFHVAGGAEAEHLLGRILDALRLQALDPASESGLFVNPNVHLAP